MSELKSYQGNCHCGLFKFGIKTPDLNNITIRTCDCSICIRKAYLWIYPLLPKNLTIESEGEEDVLTVYEFGKKDVTHFFCPKCGSPVMGRSRSSQSVGINARMLENFDIESLNTETFPGSDLPPKYQPPTFPDPSPLGDVEDGMKIYYGNCHCGAVRYTVKTKALEEEKVMKCNCSSCSRNGDHWIYPKRSSVLLEGEENLTGYAFLSSESLHAFCKICGVSVCVLVNVVGENKMMPLNVRTIDGIDISSLEFRNYDGKSQPPLYAVCIRS